MSNSGAGNGNQQVKSRDELYMEYYNRVIKDGKIVGKDVRLMPGNTSQANDATNSPFQIFQLIVPQHDPVPIPKIVVHPIRGRGSPSQMRSQLGLVNVSRPFDYSQVDPRLLTPNAAAAASTCRRADLQRSIMAANSKFNAAVHNFRAVFQAQDEKFKMLRSEAGLVEAPQFSAKPSGGKPLQRRSAVANGSGIQRAAQFSQVGLAQQARPNVPHYPAAQGRLVPPPHFTAPPAGRLNSDLRLHPQNNRAIPSSTGGNVPGGSFTNSHSALQQRIFFSHVQIPCPASIYGYPLRPIPTAQAPISAQPGGVCNPQSLNPPAKRPLPDQLAACATAQTATFKRPRLQKPREKAPLPPKPKPAKGVPAPDRTCHRCRELKPAVDFGSSVRYHSHCKDCRSRSAKLGDEVIYCLMCKKDLPFTQFTLGANNTYAKSCDKCRDRDSHNKMKKRLLQRTGAA
ncbi:hypothetical protein RUND412_005654 [Rhizina undulata]